MLSPEVIKRIRDKSRLRNIPEPDIKTIYDALYSGTFRSIAENIKEVTIKEKGSSSSSTAPSAEVTSKT